MGKFDSLIFDLDGTICNTIKDIANSVNYSLKLHNLKTYKINEFKPFLGHGSKRLILDAINNNTSLFDSVFNKYMDKYATNPSKYTKAYPYVDKFLHIAKNNGIKLFVFTNKPQKLADLVIKSCFQDNLFDEVIGVKEDTKIVKPEIDEFSKRTSKYHINYSSSAYFGDSDVDLITAKNLSVKETYITTWGYQDYNYLSKLEIKPTKFLFKYKELLNLLS